MTLLAGVATAVDVPPSMIKMSRFEAANQWTTIILS